MTGAWRTPAGGRVDRGRTVEVHFEGRPLAAHPGDTLASVLLAHGVRVVARGIYSGRPRGVVALGAEEPNAYVRVDGGPAMVRATQVEVYDGLRAHGVSGRATLPAAPDPARYDTTWRHCDVCVVGGGPAGLAAARAAAATGARVVLCDEGPDLGGGLLGTRVEVDGVLGAAWAADVGAELDAAPEVLVLRRTTVVGYYDHNLLVAVQRRTDHLGSADPTVARQRLWHLRARQVVLATGAHERALAFPDNDRPGVMLAGAAAAYVHRYGVLPGRRAVVVGGHDAALSAAVDLHDAGVLVALVADLRDAVPAALAGALQARGIELRLRHGVVGTDADGSGAVSAALVVPVDAGGAPTGAAERVLVDLCAVSAGRNPAVHLFSQSGGRLRWDDAAAAFVPAAPLPGGQCAGASHGVFGLDEALAEGHRAGVQAAAEAGFGDPGLAAPVAPSPAGAAAPATVWAVLPADGAGEDRTFLDLQRDATLRDLRRAVQAGLRSGEHVKRHTTIGTGVDQGRTSGVLTSGLLAQVLGRPVDEVGTTTYRPPYVPVSFALLAGRDRGRLADPERVTALHDWHVRHGAVFEDVGQWKRPWYYPLAGEDLAAAVRRECRAAREGVAVMDASTLGKVDLQGPDVGAFLDRIYTNVFSTLRVGHCRYGVMCRADGMVLDDGVTSRLAEDRYLMTTTTGGAARVLDWLEEWLQTEWPDLRVHCTSVTEQWATIAVVGPRSREVLARVAPDLPLDPADFPFMTFREATVAGVPARVFRISFSGELAYEVNVPAWYAVAVWEAVLEAGRPAGITPYGTETMHVLRAEKGFPIVGQDTDGTVTPLDLGMDWVVSKKKDFVGRRSFARPDTARADRKQLVGLLPEDPDVVLVEGAQLVASAPGVVPAAMHGHVTSSYRSAALGRSFALGLLRAGRARQGERLHAVSGGDWVPVTVTEPVFYDREGARRDG
ncbi:MAG: FAD-dependent oxidoreductase [Actinomycetota bacterium]